MKTRIILAALAAIVLMTPADAKPQISCGFSRGGESLCPGAENNSYGQPTAGRTRSASRRASYGDGEVIGGRPPGCPYAFCGCGVSNKVFGNGVRFVTYNGRKLNLWRAADWLAFPRASPGPGMVAANRYHVFYIERDNGDGTVLAYDPNGGYHKIWRHVISLAGYSVVKPVQSRQASN